MNQASGQRGTMAAAFVLVASFAAAGAYLWWSLRDWGLGGIGLHGTIALIVGGLGTLALAGALMFLVFYSARTGHDDVAHDDRSHEGPTQESSKADNGASQASDRR